MNPADVVRKALTEGTVWLGGELDFPTESTCEEAYQRLLGIAEQIGAMVRKSGMSMVYVYPPFDGGYWVVDWFQPEAARPKKVERWECRGAWLD
jgi:hypothetical protein